MSESNKQPYISMSIGFYLKNKPKGYLGTCSESWTFGKKPLPFSQLLGSVVYAALKFYVNTCNPTEADINSELKKLTNYIGTMSVEIQEATDEL